MDTGDIIANSIISLIISFIFAIIFAAIIHFFLGDNIYSVAILYIAIATIPSVTVTTSESRFSGIFVTLLTTIIIYLIMYFVFPMIFGPNITFPYSMLDLGPFNTGLIVSVIVSMITVLTRL